MSLYKNISTHRPFIKLNAKEIIEHVLRPIYKQKAMKIEMCFKKLIRSSREERMYGSTLKKYCKKWKSAA